MIVAKLRPRTYRPQSVQGWWHDLSVTFDMTIYIFHWMNVDILYKILIQKIGCLIKEFIIISSNSANPTFSFYSLWPPKRFFKAFWAKKVQEGSQLQLSHCPCRWDYSHSPISCWTTVQNGWSSQLCSLNSWSYSLSLPDCVSLNIYVKYIPPSTLSLLWHWNQFWLIPLGNQYRTFPCIPG